MVDIFAAVVVANVMVFENDGVDDAKEIGRREGSKENMQESFGGAAWVQFGAPNLKPLNPKSGVTIRQLLAFLIFLISLSIGTNIKMNGFIE